MDLLRVVVVMMTGPKRDGGREYNNARKKEERGRLPSLARTQAEGEVV